MGSFEVVQAVLGTLRWRLNGELAGAEAQSCLDGAKGR